MINKVLREQHLQTIGHPVALGAYDSLCELGELREGGGLNAAAQQIIGDYVALEQIKQDLYMDVVSRGVAYTYSNGRQRLTVNNKNVPQIRAIVDQQRKLLAELRFTPASTKAAEIPLTDDFGNF